MGRQQKNRLNSHLLNKRHSLYPVAVRVADEGGVVIVGIMRARAGFAITCTTVIKSCLVEFINSGSVGCAQANMCARGGGHFRHILTQVNPEFRVFFTKAHRVGLFGHNVHIEGLEESFVKPTACRQIRNLYGNMIYHCRQFLTCRHRCITAIIIKAAPGFASEPACFHIFHQQRTRAVFCICKAFIQHLHDRQAGIQPDEISQL